LMDEVRVFSRELSALEVRGLYDSAAVGSLVKELGATGGKDLEDLFFGAYLASESSAYAKALSEVRTARQGWYKLLNAQREIMVMQETPKPKRAYVLFRGEYDKRRDEVFAGTPKALNSFPEGAPRNRLGLAQWLTDPANPLLSRVTVNRIWQMLFGRGLVRTSEDLGSQGSQPEIPEVLEWLAYRFLSEGWDVKGLIRTIVMSHTYRQESSASPELVADDPENTWLGRGPRFRMSAEMIRDTFLRTSGLLVQKVGGAPVTPYEMAEAFRPAKVDAGEGVFRRSLYTQWRRTAPPPAMMTFDAPRRGVCSAKRERTNTPLQALVLLNGPQYVEAARVLGERLHLKHTGNVEGMVQEGFLACLSRFPDAREKDISVRLYQEQLSYFQKHPEEADRLLQTGQKKRDGSVGAPEAAAAAVLAQALLNHDGCVVKQ
jgi:hypothetical protein